ncbi:MAG: hypothetical protein RSE13_03465 [Planktothrix sp. GU0601_MAG3]|nr:MAG: hypothetical protein RSE13_03465 [Planktothrix sp. GU0601_MAG3]
MGKLLSQIIFGIWIQGIDEGKVEVIKRESMLAIAKGKYRIKFDKKPKLYYGRQG